MHSKIQNLDSIYRRTTEDSPITVRPYMITENDLADLGHATCHTDWNGPCNAAEPEWLVNGWASCTAHLTYTIQDAAAFNENYRIWHNGE